MSVTYKPLMLSVAMLNVVMLLTNALAYFEEAEKEKDLLH
jgi:hypothetical protein